VFVHKARLHTEIQEENNIKPGVVYTLVILALRRLRPTRLHGWTLPHTKPKMKIKSYKKEVILDPSETTPLSPDSI
jgi:hypothetical protein